MFLSSSGELGVTIRQQTIERKSAERLVFEHYLRTGRWLRPEEDEDPAEQKFNPYHEPVHLCA